MSGVRILFKNLWLADGSGSPLRRSRVLTGDRIILAEAADLTDSSADRVVDLRGRILAPGFIDAHGHSDLSLPSRPAAFGKVSQGITCEIMGNCGLSAFPVTSRNRAHLQELWQIYGVPIDWETGAGWREMLCNSRTALTPYALTGHNTLRAAVAGYEQRELSGSQLDDMIALLNTELSTGSPGLSSGLLYVPGKFADTDELTGLLQTVAQHDKIYATHLRSEGDFLLESLEETVELAQKTGLRRLHISHFKTAGPRNWHKLDAAIACIETARAAGLRVTVDRYPYTASMTQLSVILPGRYADCDDIALMKMLRDPTLAAEVAQQLTADRDASEWDRITLINCAEPALRGQSVATAAREMHLSPPESVVALLARDAAGTTAAFRGMSEGNLQRILALTWCMMGSDENARPADDSIGRGHPRGFGSAARFLRLRLDGGADPAAAVHQMTGLPAATFQLEEHGTIAPGRRADLTAFDPDTVDGRSDFAAPHTPAAGILFTMHDGEFVYRGGDGD